MACVSPLRGFCIGVTDKGKDKYLIRKFDVDHIERVDGHWYTCYDKDEVYPYNDKIIRESIKIPCGKCTGCRLDYARRWSERLLMERKTSSSGFFLTLTYNDENLPISIIENKDFAETGEVSAGYTLNLRDLQLFFKRLRRRFPNSNIRMFSAGEYGSLNMRPHYHSIVFNLPEEELGLKFYKRVRGNNYYTSDVLQRVWSKKRIDHNGKSVRDENGKIIYDPIGFLVIGEFSVASASYVARYCLKKANTDIKWSDYYVDLGIDPEFVVMSRKPHGIGYDYFYRNKEAFVKYGSIDIGDENGSHHISMNRFFSNQLELLYPGIFPEIKELRKEAAQVRWEAELLDTDLDELTYYQVKKDNLESRIKSLRREL